ncbi:ImmA/IrrE family metallo-endopeptidase [Pseudomonas nitroreducens]|uniref:DUF955 domain-containing protein n=1 Tax=Pseudomonas nitroreducens TaxID=46680 RepID=A0A246F7L1_PSENT|nr:DUF955 domain-containing protein [Pseudomonas nitroreducens]OWP49195.1 DUF955 domain-containing protein [Pseudomonas nitroreducens]
MTSEELPYRMRGHRVPEFSSAQIGAVAQRVCGALRLRRRSFRPGTVEKLVAQLEHYRIYVDPIEDEEWLDATRATVNPQTGMIYMPLKLYNELCRGKPEAIRIFLHELGHIFLCHKPMLHFSDGPGKQEYDSEWQADFFADSVIEYLNLPRFDGQLELKF